MHFLNKIQYFVVLDSEKTREIIENYSKLSD